MWIGLVAIVVALGVASVVGVLSRTAKFRVVRRPVPADGERGRNALTEADLGAPLGERATLVQFSTDFCAPCRAARQVLGRVAETVEGVRHVEIDATARLDLVKRFNVTTTPTVLVLDHAGEVTRKATGSPKTADVIAALGEAVPVELSSKSIDNGIYAV
jgi:thiol-disulfide isomerase/thioredoxin